MIADDMSNYDEEGNECFCLTNIGFVFVLLYCILLNFLSTSAFHSWISVL